VASCYVKGYGLRRGATATSVAHDSHNIIACGVKDADVVCAVNRLREMGGGMVVAEDGKIVAELALPIAGLITDRPLAEVNAALERCKTAAVERGTQPGIDPFMTMSFASLPVIPTLRLTTRGVIDVNTQTIIS
ncbi:MAG: adenine deaminase, partial [Clostridia bacterium]|nr:adenine deaminase [Clostridia bacterium]